MARAASQGGAGGAGGAATHGCPSCVLLLVPPDEEEEKEEEEGPEDLATTSSSAGCVPFSTRRYADTATGAWFCTRSSFFLVLVCCSGSLLFGVVLFVSGVQLCRFLWETASRVVFVFLSLV